MKTWPMAPFGPNVQSANPVNAGRPDGNDFLNVSFVRFLSKTSTSPFWAPGMQAFRAARK